jgi:hypothetical protein
VLRPEVVRLRPGKIASIEDVVGGLLVGLQPYLVWVSCFGGEDCAQVEECCRGYGGGALQAARFGRALSSRFSKVARVSTRDSEKKSSNY